MPRHARIVVPGLLHHITQRGNRRAQVFSDDEDREVFLAKLAHYAERAELLLASYCLMTNHTHMLAIPLNENSLSLTFKPLHMCHSQRLNKRSRQSGVNWQGRYFSSPLSPEHSHIAFQYVALNPVRARMASVPEEYKWSSAKDHITNSSNPLLTADKNWLNAAHLAVNECKNLNIKSRKRDSDFEILRRNTFSNLPTGSEEFISKLAKEFGRSLTLGKPGRPKNIIG